MLIVERMLACGEDCVTLGHISLHEKKGGYLVAQMPSPVGIASNARVLTPASLTSALSHPRASGRSRRILSKASLLDHERIVGDPESG